MQNMNEARQYDNQMMGLGESLARNHDLVLYESIRNPDDRLRMGDLIEGIADDRMRATTAIIFDNMRREFANLDETTRLVHVGSFEKWAYPMVRAVLPSLVAQDLVSVQPMQGPVGLVFYLKYLYNMTKGSATAGTDMIEYPNEYYSSDIIDLEVVGAGDGVTVAFTPTLLYTPVQPGTVRITATIGSTDYDIVDDGNGALTGAALAANGTINYATGVCSFTYSTAPDASTNLEATYSYNMEANSTVPAVDLSIESAPVRARTRKLAASWSVEAQADLTSQYGLSADTELAAMTATEIKYEIDRYIVNSLRRMASNTIATAWSQSPGTGVSQTEHELSFVKELIKSSNAIYSTTKRAVGSWAMVGTNVATVVENLPGFKGTGKSIAGTRGVYHAGTLNNRWEIYKDANYPVNEYLVGYKGDYMWDTGYIYSPYIPIMVTDTYTLNDFVVRKGIGSRAGHSMIDGRFYCTGSITT